MNGCLRTIGVSVMGLACSGCLSVTAPAEVSVGPSAPPKADCGPAPATYDDAVAAWQRLCDRNAYLERQNARLERKYGEAKRDKEEYKHKYKKLKDKYED